MSWDGYFTYAGQEFINAQRTEAYAKAAGAGWLKGCFGGTDLGPMLGERYRNPWLDPAPWTDPDVPESYGFFGVYPLGVTGLEDSTRVGAVVESIKDGGTVGRIRNNTRAVVFNVALVAENDCAADYGARWLRRLLLGAACGTQVTEACAGEDLCYLSCEPVLDWTGTDSSAGTSPINPIPVDAPTISLATVITPTDIAACTALNQNLDTDPGLIAPFMKWLDRVHSENHTTSGIYNIWCGAKNKGTSPTTLGAKMTTAGMGTSVYGHGSYVMQARPEESPDLEANYPLGMSIFFPGNPDEERTPEMLTIDPTTGRDEVGFEGTTANFWAARGPTGATSALVTASTPTTGTVPRSGVQCLAVTMGSTPGQLTASTGVTTGIAKPCFQGMKVEGGFWVKPRTTVRAVNAEIRWMNAAFTTVATTTGIAATESTGWIERTVSGEAPAGAVWWALYARWAGPPVNGEIHYIDDATGKDFASRLIAGITGSQTSITLRSAQRLRPTDSIASVDTTANTLTHTAHGLAANTVVYMVGTNLPVPLNETTSYYVLNPTANTFQLSLTAGGAAIDFSNTGAQSKYTKAPPNWPFRAPRAGDPTPTASTVSTHTAQCVHWVRIDDEIMGITAVSGPTLGVVTLTVVRGMWGTSPTVHDPDAKVYSPVYVGSISEGADATFAGSPQVNDATKALRYSLALEQGLSQPKIKRATEWVAKRRIMEMLEYDWASNPVNVPETSNSTLNPPSGWNGYVSAGSDNKSVNSLYLDITGTSFYNMADSWGYDVIPWSIIGVPNSEPPLPPEAMQTQAALAEAQINKIADLRTYMTSVGIPSPQVVIGNNLAWQGNVQDPYKQRIIDSGVLDYANLEFWLNDPTAVIKYEAQRTQWMLCCKNNLKVCVWPKTGQNGVANTPFDSAPVGTASAADVAHYRRWCYAHFLLGWRGSANQQLVTEWGLGFEAAMEPEFTYQLGDPIDEFDTWEDLPEIAPGIKYRDYEQGRVVLNTTGASYLYELDVLMKDLSTPGLDEVIIKTIPAYDAAYLHAIPVAGGAPDESTLLDILNCLDPYERSLRRVVFNTGPTITAKRTTTSGGAVWTATMTAVAGNPWEFSAEQPIVEGFVGQQAAYVCNPPGHVATFTRVVDDTSCMPTANYPVFDPSCPAFVPPPEPVNVPLGCYSPPANWKRRQFTIPKEFIPLWGEVVPKIEIHANGKDANGRLVAVRNLRLRFYADVDDNGLVTPASEDEPGENCAYCGDIVVSYVPAGETLVLDGSDELVYVEKAGGMNKRRADSLVFATDGTPFEWPVLSCGFAYVVAVDTEQTASLPTIDLSLYARVA